MSVEPPAPKGSRVGSYSLLKRAVGVIAFWYPVLSALSRLRTWADVIEHVRTLGTELYGIAIWFGLLIHAILGPWRWIRDLVFDFAARFAWFRIPVDWRDPVVLGMFVWLLPIRNLGALYLLGVHSQVQINLLRGVLKALQRTPTTPEERERVSAELQKLVDHPAVFALAVGDVTDYIRRLNRDLPTDLLETQALLAKGQIAVAVQEMTSIRTEGLKEYKARVIRDLAQFALALSLVVLFSIDQLHAGGLGVAVGVMWRSLVMMGMLATIPILLWITTTVVLILLSKQIDALLRTRIARRLGGRMFEQTRPWIFRHLGKFRASPPRREQQPEGRSGLTALAMPHPEILGVAKSQSGDHIWIYHRNLAPYCDIHRMVYDTSSHRFIAVKLDDSKHPFGQTCNDETTAFVASGTTVTIALKVGDREIDWWKVPLELTPSTDTPLSVVTPVRTT